MVAQRSARSVKVEFFEDGRSALDQAYYEERIDLTKSESARDGPPPTRRARHRHRLPQRLHVTPRSNFTM